MNKIIVKCQEDWGKVPSDFDGYVYIESPKNTRLIIAERKGIVVARGNSSVEAWENSSVVAWGNVQIAKYSDYAKLQTHGNSRIVTLPKTIEEYCDFHGIIVQDGYAILHKSVRSNLTSFHDRDFQYAVGENKSEVCDQRTDVTCSNGIHVSYLTWALNFGKGYDNFKIIECSVPLDKIILPTNSDGKVRTSELTVLREIPLEECGLHGKFLAKKMVK